jgi:hypothetical protein
MEVVAGGVSSDGRVEGGVTGTTIENYLERLRSLILLERRAVELNRWDKVRTILRRKASLMKEIPVVGNVGLTGTLKNLREMEDETIRLLRDSMSQKGEELRRLKLCRRAASSYRGV